MKQILFTMAIASIVTAQDIKFGEYTNRDLENISFTDAITCTGVYTKRGVTPGTQGPVNGSTGSDVDTAAIMLKFNYAYDSLTNRIIMNNNYNGPFMDLDDQKRVTKITNGKIRTTRFTYDQNKITVIDLPNDTAITRHSCQWETWYRPDGQIEKIVKTPMDWTYEGPLFWATEHADTTIHSYDESGRKTGTKLIRYTADLFHSFPWVRAIDSIAYEYDDVQKSVTAHSLSPFGDTWSTTSQDTQWVAIYNDKNQIQKQTKRRWDGARQIWDTLYYTIATYEWTDSLLTGRHEILHYGTGSSTMAIWDEIYFYGDNPLVAGSTPTLPAVAKLNNSLQMQSSGDMIVCRGQQVDRLIIVGMNGRIIREIRGESTISLEGLSRNQPLVTIAFFKGKQIGLLKLAGQK